MHKDELIEQLATGKMTRRKFSRLLASVGIATVTFPVWTGRASAATEDHPTIFTWEGFNSPELHMHYSDKYGESPNFAIWGDEEEAFAKMRAGFNPDLTQPCSYKIPVWRKAGILQPIDTDRLSNWGSIIPSLKEIPGIVVEDKRYWLCADWGQTSVVYREDLVDIEEESWTLLWDERYKGRLAMADSLIDGVMVAAIVAGAKDPYNMTADEMEKTRELLRKQLPLLRYYWTSTADIVQAIGAGELVASSAWNDAYTELKRNGVPVKFMNPKEGAMTWSCGFCLMSFADPAKVDRAYDYMDAYISPEAGAFEIMEFGYGHANIKAFDLVSDEDLARRGLTRHPQALLSSGIFQEPMSDEPALQAMFEEVKAGL